MPMDQSLLVKGDDAEKGVKTETKTSIRTLDMRNVPSGHTARFVGGHPIIFPGVPYSVQLPYMERVVRALDGSENALLEAPTGVGKTRALLCASMQWLVDEQNVFSERLQQHLLSFREAAANTSNSAPAPSVPENTRPENQKGAEESAAQEGAMTEIDAKGRSTTICSEFCGDTFSSDVSVCSAALRESLWSFSCSSPNKHTKRQYSTFRSEQQIADGGQDVKTEDDGGADSRNICSAEKRIKYEVPCCTKTGDRPSFTLSVVM